MWNAVAGGARIERTAAHGRATRREIACAATAMNPAKDDNEELEGQSNLAARLKLDRVLVPLDGFPGAEFGLAFAGIFSHYFNSNLVLFHVLPPADPVHQARGSPVRYPYALRDRGANLANSYLREISSKLARSGIEAQWSVATGNTAELISMRAVTGGFGLIVLAVSPPDIVKRKARRTPAVELWEKTAVPVLIVDARRMYLNGAPPKPPTRLLVPRHARDLGRESLDMAEAIAAQTGAAISLVCSRPPQNRPPSHIQQEVFRMREAGLDAQLHTSTHSIMPALEEIQNEHPGSWVVITSKMRSWLARTLQRSVADKVVRRSTAPVLAIPAQDIANRRIRKLRALNPEELGVRQR